jgi:hypothetical protein
MLEIIGDGSTDRTVSRRARASRIGKLELMILHEDLVSSLADRRPGVGWLSGSRVAGPGKDPFTIGLGSGCLRTRFLWPRLKVNCSAYLAIRPYALPPFPVTYLPVLPFRRSGSATPGFGNSVIVHLVCGFLDATCRRQPQGASVVSSLHVVSDLSFLVINAIRSWRESCPDLLHILRRRTVHLSCCNTRFADLSIFGSKH